MFVTYPVEATHDNWIHESIMHVLEAIFTAINTNTEIQEWPDILPQEHKDKLSNRRSLPNLFLLVERALRADEISQAQRDQVWSCIHQQNDIDNLLSGRTNVQALDDDLSDIVQAIKAVFEEGFRLLKETGVRDQHYKKIYKKLISKSCPFCGYEPFDAPGLRREDEDHYLLRDKYPFAAANFLNLVPMGGRCNKSYKLQQDVLFSGGVRRKSLNPYGNAVVDISLNNSDLFGEEDFLPLWDIQLVPDTEEARTWESVFSIRDRLSDSVLKPSYDRVLNEVSDWFVEKGVHKLCSDEEVVNSLNRLAGYKNKNREEGTNFLKHKTVETISYHFASGHRGVIALIRSSLKSHDEVLMLQDQMEVA